MNSTLIKEDFNFEANEIKDKLLSIWEQVLRHDKVTFDDSFVALGGNSLKAIELEWRISEAFGVEIPIERIFTSITITKLAKLLANFEKTLKQGNKHEKRHLPIDLQHNNEYYEASSAQKRMYALNQFNKNETNYNIPSFRVIEGKLDTERFIFAFKELVKRHEILRTSFDLVNEDVVQFVHKDIDFEVPYYEIEEAEIEDRAKRFISFFDLSKAPLMRAELLKISEDKHLLLFDIHHIISDGISMGILWEELFKLYQGEKLEPLKIQYKDFSAWQNEHFKSEVMKKQEEYWLEVFKEEIPVLGVPTDYVRPIVSSFEGDAINFKIEKNSYEKLKDLMIETNTTMYMVLLAVYNVLLSKYSGQEDIIVGSPIAGRRHEDLSNMMGMFVNTLAMRNYPRGVETFRNFLLEVRESALNAYENQDYQFEELVEKLNISRDMSRHPLFDTMFVLQNMDRSKIDIQELNFKGYGVDNKTSKFDMTLYATEKDEEIYLGIEYATKLFKKETIERMVGHFLKIVSEVVENYDIELSKINMLTEKERNQILCEFNNTKADYPKDKTIHQLFEEQVEKTPNNIAVVYEEKSMTYRDLNEKSNQLARLLRCKGVKADTIVGIMVERSIEMIVGIMGILKAGGAYLPIDPNYPKDRIEYILKDSGTKLILSKMDLIGKIELGCEVIDLFKDNLFKEASDNLNRANDSCNLAYVIYTSGTTGNPKGTMIEHKALVNRLIWMQNKYPINEKDTILQKTTYTFDVSVWELLWWSMVGAKVCMLNPNDEKSH